MSAGGLAERSQATAPFAPPGPPQAPGRRDERASLPGAPPGGVGLRTRDATLARAAREGADFVGDACVVWQAVDDGRRLEPAATHHRDRRLRHALGAFLDQSTLEPDSHWPGQVAWHGAPVRVRRARLLDLGVDPGVGMRRAHALLVPVLDGGRVVAVIAALREVREPRYSLREEVVLRRVAAKLAVRLGVGLDGWRAARGGAAGGGGRNGDGPDGDGPGGESKPPRDGPGWAPPPSWLMDHLAVGIWITDRHGATTYVNNTMTELLGIPSQTLIGRPMHDFLDDVPQMLRGEYCMDAERCDRRLTQPDGRHLWLEMTSAPLVDDDGRRRGTINTVVDVTDRKKVELAARQRVPRPHRRV
jgi:PAS domain S-box-containing protein